MKSGALRKERENYGNFQRYILEDLLGYENVKLERDNVDFVVPGADGHTSHMLVVECKDTNAGLDKKQHRENEAHKTPMDQLWDYMRYSEWGIATNYRLFRLVKRSRGINNTQEIDFQTLYDEDRPIRSRIAEFVYVFGEIVKSGDDSLDKDVDMEDREITNRFYRVFSDTRLMLAREFEVGCVSRSDAVHKAQIFLNRLVFLFFVEDRDMVKNGLFMRQLRGSLGWRFPDDTTDAVCRSIRDDLFRVMDGGYNRPRIPKFNGGLFRDGSISDVSFRDYRDAEWFVDVVPDIAPVSSYYAKTISKEIPRLSPIILNMVEMRQYSFRSDIDINILGHVFEQSIQDIDDMEADSVRRREGIYYTPSYITDWICRNTILPYLSLSKTIQEPEDLVREYAEQGRLVELEKRLHDLRVLDPACGSGAFITGAAALLLELHTAIHDMYVLNRGQLSAPGQERLDKWNADAVMRRIITDNIYGVDKNPQAVKIAQLSLFLLVASPDYPLPDTSRHIISGNSIVSDGMVTSDAVQWAKTFPEIFASNNPGFDIIIGNPPYGAGLTADERTHLKGEFDIGGTNTAAIFIHQSLRLLKEDGMHSFIVPKSLMFSSKEWIRTREVLLPDMVWMVDVGKVWREVLLEQCIYVVRKGSGATNYSSGVRASDTINVATDVDKSLVSLFGVFPSVASKAEIDLGKKIIETSYMLGEYVTNRRGAPLSRNRATQGIAVIGGKQVQPYHVKGIKFHVQDVDDEKAHVTDRSVLVQRLVAHITTPADHIRIAATIPPNVDLVIDETVNNLTVEKTVSPHYILGLLHSKIINWYVYRFVFSKGIRSIQFDPPTTNKTPVIVAREDEVIRLAKAMLMCCGGGGGAEANAEAKRLASKLDNMFYDIFDLTAREIRMVEESFEGGPPKPAT